MFSGFHISLNSASYVMKGQIDDIQESAVLEGYSCKDSQCKGFLLRDCGISSVIGSMKPFLVHEVAIAVTVLFSLCARV